MKSVVFCLVLVLLCRSTLAQLPATTTGIEKVENTQDLATYSGNAQLLVVASQGAGGVFYYTTEKQTPDNGIIFQGENKGYWVRIYDKADGVNLAWFGAKMDSVTDDGDAFKRALAYTHIKVTGNCSISSKTIIPDSRTIEFTEGGSFTITDTIPLKINAFVKANDYQWIFRGTGKVIFGSYTVPYVSACWFGARSNCIGFERGKGVDNTEAIQKAIFAAQRVSDLYLPPAAANSSYRITSTITISKKLHFFSFRFHGGGTTITYSNEDRATNIFADFTEGAAINVQGSRRVYLTDFALRGLNNMPRRLAAYDTIDITNVINDPNTFLSKGLNLNYAAITTDGEKDNKTWSADISFDRLQIENFSIGIGISQAGHVQGDRMRVENTQINQCVYGISIGQAQNRACHFYNVDMNRNWCGITNTAFGDHTGSVFQVTGGQWCNVFKCFIMQPSYLGQCVVSGLYTEAIGCIGVIGENNPNNSSVIFSGCEFSMQDNGFHAGYAFTAPFYTLSAYGNVTFEGCNFWSARGYLAMLAGANDGGYTGSTITMNGCSVHKCATMHIKGNAMIENTFLIPISGTISYNRSITTDFEGNRRYNTGYTPVTAISGMEFNNANSNNMYGSRQISRRVPRFYSVQEGKTGITDISMHRDTVKFSFNESLYQSFFRYARPGDRIGTTIPGAPYTLWDNPTLVVASIDSVTRTAKCSAFIAGFSFDKIGLYTNSFFTIQPITGTVKNGSRTITNTHNYIKLQEGDFITFSGAARAYRIAGINKDDSSITLMDPVTDQVDGNVNIFNELLEDNNKENGSATATPIRTTYENTTLTPADATLIVSNLKNDIVITLPANATRGHIYNVKKLAGGHIATITPQRGTIDGKNNYILKDDYQGVQLLFDGNDYLILGK